MAKTLYFANAPASMHRGTSDAKLGGTTAFWTATLLSESRGGGVVASPNMATVTGPTNGIEVGVVSTPLEWISEPLSADFTISGTITCNLWGAESSMNANVSLNAVIDKIDGATGTLTRVATGANATELALTTATANNFTITPTSTACKRGDRLRVRVAGDDGGGNQVGGFTFFFSYAGTTAAANGDSYIQFTENLTFEPAGDPGSGSSTDYNQTTGATAFAIGDQTSEQRVAMSFTALTTKITKVRASIAFVGTHSDNLIVEIQSDNAGAPSGTVIGTVATFSPGSLTTSITPYEQTCNITLSQGATYWIVFSRSGSVNATNYFRLFVTLTDPGGGWPTARRYDGSTWTSSTGYLVAGYTLTAPAVSVPTYYLTNARSGVSGAPTLVSNFTGADENPLSEGGNWANLNSSTSPLRRSSNAVIGSTAFTCFSYWTPANFGPDLDAYVTVATVGSSTISAVLARIQGEGGAGTWDGYSVGATNVGPFVISRYDNASATTLVSVAQTIASGDKIGIRCKGSLIQGWRQASGSSQWDLICSAIDTTYSSAGKIGLRVGGTGPILDDFYALTDSNLFAQGASTTRGAGSVNSAVSAIAGPVAPALVNEWYTPALNAVTFGGKAKFNIRALESSSTVDASLKAEIAITAGDGSGATVWGVANVDANNVGGSVGELPRTDGAVIAWVSGDDTSITSGQRLRFRIYVDDPGDAPLGGGTVTVSYNGTTAVAAGDTYVILPVAVTEQATSIPSLVFDTRRVSRNSLLRR